MTEMTELPEAKIQTPGISIPEDITRFEELGLIDVLLRDRTTGKNIIWATSAYENLGSDYGKQDAIVPKCITGTNSSLIRRRAAKDKDEKSALTRQHAEVFTPAWIVKLMVDEADKAWREGRRRKSLSDGWQSYVSSNRLEITCGEAPYLVNRYDAADGSVTPISERTGILSRKLALVNENVKTRETWMKWAKTALRSIYGYEYQGDNLLIARINVLCTMEDYLKEAGFECFVVKEYEELANIISWNLWQMDGLTKCVPFGKSIEDAPMPTLFDVPEELKEETYSDCLIYDWEKNESIMFSSIRRGSPMKFDYIIGNPPYQEDGADGDRKQPLYNHFMDECYDLSDVVELITPGRFLFDAGQTPKEWNRAMLDDPHLKVLYYNPNSSEIFQNTEIKGGVTITIHDTTRNYGSIGTFTAFPELNEMLKKVRALNRESGWIKSIVASQGLYKFADSFFNDFPEISKISGAGTGAKIVSSTMEKMPCAFLDKKPNDGEAYVEMIGRVGGKRERRYLNRRYIQPNQYIDTHNVLVPEANGSGALGEVLSTPLIGAPLIGHTDTFLSFGAFETQEEAQALEKYLKTKFARTLLGSLKVTQHNGPSTWANVPLQDFTSISDIDWSRSVAEIDEQLYKKYGLSPEEIEFIETHVKEMD